MNDFSGDVSDSTYYPTPPCSKSADRQHKQHASTGGSSLLDTTISDDDTPALVTPPGVCYMNQYSKDYAKLEALSRQNKLETEELKRQICELSRARPQPRPQSTSLPGTPQKMCSPTKGGTRCSFGKRDLSRSIEVLSPVVDRDRGDKCHKIEFDESPAVMKDIFNNDIEGLNRLRRALHSALNTDIHPFPSTADVKLIQTASLSNPTSRNLHSISRSESGLGTLSGRTQDNPSTEDTHLKALLDKETYRRNHCEKRIEELQRQILETEQELAVAESYNHLKTKEIKTLNSELARLTDEINERTRAQTELIDKTRAEKAALEGTCSHQKNLLIKVEKELTSALQQLRETQTKAGSAEERLNNLLKESQASINKLKRQAKDWEIKCEKLESKLQCKSDETKTLQTDFNEMKSRCRDLETEGAARRSEAEKLKGQVGDELKRRKTSDTLVNRLETMCVKIENEMTQLKDKLAHEIKAKECFRNELEFLKGEQTNFYKELELNHQREIDKMINDNRECQMAADRMAEERLAERTRDLESRLDSTVKFYESEADKLKAKQANEVGKFRDRCNGLQKKVDFLEAARSKLTSRLQSLLQNQWCDTVKVLYGNELNGSPTHSSSNQRSNQSQSGNHRPPLMTLNLDSTNNLSGPLPSADVPNRRTYGMNVVQPERDTNAYVTPTKYDLKSVKHDVITSKVDVTPTQSPSLMTSSSSSDSPLTPVLTASQKTTLQLLERLSVLTSAGLDGARDERKCARVSDPVPTSGGSGSERTAELHKYLATLMQTTTECQGDKSSDREYRIGKVITFPVHENQKLKYKSESENETTKTAEPRTKSTLRKCSSRDSIPLGDTVSSKAKKKETIYCPGTQPMTKAVWK